MFTFHQLLVFNSKVAHRSCPFLLRDLCCTMSPKCLPLGDNSQAGSMLSETLTTENSTIVQCKGFTLEVPFPLPGCTVIVRTHASSVWHLHKHPCSCRKVCYATISPFTHIAMEKRTVFLNQGHPWFKMYSVGSKHKQTPSPPALLRDK